MRWRRRCRGKRRPRWGLDGKFGYDFLVERSIDRELGFGHWFIGRGQLRNELERHRVGVECIVDYVLLVLLRLVVLLGLVVDVVVFRVLVILRLVVDVIVFRVFVVVLLLIVVFRFVLIEFFLLEFVLWIELGQRRLRSSPGRSPGDPSSQGAALLPP